MATKKGSDNRFPLVRLTYEDDTPATPPADEGHIVVGVDKVPRFIDDDGTLTVLGGASVAELDDVGDVNAPTPSNGDVLTWDSTPGEWVATAPTGGTTVATDTIWNAAGDLAVGSGSDTAARLGVGSNGNVLTVVTGAPAWAAPAGGGGGPAGVLPIQSVATAGGGGATTIVVTIAAASSGNTLIACIAGGTATTVSSIASTNTTWSLVARSTASGTPHVDIWKGLVAGGSSGTTVTATYSSSTAERAIIVSEWPSSITGTLDQTAQVTTFASTATYGRIHTPAILPTDQDALVVACATTTDGSVRFAWASDMIAFDAMIANTSTVQAFMGAWYCFPGTVPVSLNAFGPTAGNFSAVIASMT